MNKSGYSLKPEGVFSGIVPIGRCMYGKQIYLKPLSLKDTDLLFKLMTENQEELSEWYHGLPKKISRGAVILFIKEEQRVSEKGERLDLGVFLIDGNKLIGKISIHSVTYGIEMSAGLSYWIAPEHRKQGYATQAVACMNSFAFEEATLHRLWALVDPENLASLKILDKLGYRNEGTIKAALYIKKKWRDMNQLSLLEEEYDSLADKWIEKGWLGI